VNSFSLFLISELGLQRADEITFGFAIPTGNFFSHIFKDTGRGYRK
jgi:hypothetical protein